MNWRYGGPVFAKQSHNYESLTLELQEIKKDGLVFKDKQGHLYNTQLDYVEFILPPFTIPTYSLKRLLEV